MKTGIHVGNMIDKDASKNLSGIIETIFTQGSKNNIEQKTIREALKLVGTVSEIKTVNISSCSIINDRLQE